MVNLYCSLIINKRRNFDQIPDNLKADLESLGLDENGCPV